VETRQDGGSPTFTMRLKMVSRGKERGGKGDATPASAEEGFQQEVGSSCQPENPDPGKKGMG